MIWLRACAALAIVVSLVAFAFWFYPWAWAKWYDVGMAITLCLTFYIVWKGVPDKWVAIFGFIGFGFAVNNLIDEIFFNPEETGWNEYVFATLIIVIAWQKFQKKRK